MDKSLKARLAKEYKIAKNELKKYLLVLKADFEILEKCKIAEKKKLCKEDRELVRLIKSQLEKDWRKPLHRELDKLIRRYRKLR